MTRNTATRGAALIIVVALLAILTGIGLAFFSATRDQLERAEAVRDAARAELLAHGGAAIAISFLNQDLVLHPTATSYDHAWRTYFNGAWVAGKEWAFHDGGGESPFVDAGLTWADALPESVAAGGPNPRDLTPYINYDVLLQYAAAHPDDPGEPESWERAVLAKERTGGLYIPRYQGNALAASDYYGNPFVLPPDHQLYDPEAAPENLAALMDVLSQAEPEEPDRIGLFPEEIVDLWADVDSDGDGLRDAMWIPVPRDRFFPRDGLDNDLDGMIDEQPDDGIDSDGDGIDETADLDDDGVDDRDATEAVERGVFVYWGGDDTLDNDGDGAVDELDEQKPFLTCRLHYMADHDGDPDTADVPQILPNITVERRIYDDPDDPAAGYEVETYALDNTSPDSPDIDKLDNNLDLMVNFSRGFVYEGPDVGGNWLPVDQWPTPALNAAGEPVDPFVFYARQLRRAHHEINVQRYFPALFNNNELVRVTSSGEPVCAIAGRLAVHITDESEKVNLAAAGAHGKLDYRDVDGPNFDGPIERALNLGLNPGEYETRLLPNIGTLRASRLWSLRTGAPDGVGFTADVREGGYEVDGLRDGLGPYDAPVPPPPLVHDMALPGYGGVDDDGDLLWASMNGLDDDGDGLVDEGLYVPENPDDPLYDEYRRRLGLFEGVDEPDEARHFRPLRNAIAENDAVDNDGDGIIDEVGELGDSVLYSAESLKGVYGLGETIYNSMRSLVTVNSVDRNDRWQRFDERGDRLHIARNSGLKLDPNYARAFDIATMLKKDWGFPINPVFDPVLRDLGLTAIISDADLQALAFGLGLRRGDMSLAKRIDTGLPDLFALDPAIEPDSEFAVFATDEDLKARQIAVNARDFRDPDNSRSIIDGEVEDRWWAAAERASGVAEEDIVMRPIEYNHAGVEAIRITEMMVRPVRRVEAEVDSASPLLDPNVFSGMGALGQGNAPDFNVQRDFYGGGAWQLRPSDNMTAPVLGPHTSWWTDSPNWGGRPSLIQYRFGPSPGLPPGRYYLTVNVTMPDGNRTIVEPTDLRYMVRYGLAGQSIVADLNAVDDGGLAAVQAFVAANARVGDAHIGYDNMDAASPGTESGWLFLPTQAVGDPADPYRMGNAYTVEIPPYAANAGDQVYLYVALGLAEADAQLSVNFFDFSQEPDHEYVEITNVAREGEPVDLSGWELEVGAPGTGKRIVGSVPDETYIAPGGRLLLGVNKFDEGAAVFGTSPTESPFFRNGIGLVRYDGHPNLGGVSEPPFPVGLPTTNLTAPVVDGVTYSRGLPLGQSVFSGASAMTLDFLDDNGDGVIDTVTDFDDDGVPDAHVYDGSTAGAMDLFPAGEAPNGVIDAIDLTGDGEPDVFDTNEDGVTDRISTDRTGEPDITLWDNLVTSTPVGTYPAGISFASDAAKPFDRIVQLDIRNIANVDTASDLDFIADWVLGGGILPNYPEHDGVDNDGDNSVLSRDGVDNDGDYLLAAANGIDDDSDGTVDEADEGLDESIAGAPREGIDENRVRMFAQRLQPGSSMVVPGGYDERPMAVYTAMYPALGAFQEYYGGPDDPPDWKAFIERRMFPGDCVMVTLYEGEAIEGRVADRVTYSELDVTNGAPDDIVPADMSLVYDPDHVPPQTPVAERPITLDSRYPTFWPGDTMGRDFYRALERKHPLYAGDRFGTQNRWQATDGNYDDWSPAPSRWERVLDEDGNALSLFDRLTVGSGGSTLADFQTTLRLFFGHALSGSPLRASLAERYIENPPLFQRTDDDPTVALDEAQRQFAQDEAGAAYDRYVRWSFGMADVHNGPLSSPGDFMAMPLFLDRHVMADRDQFAYLVTDTPINESVFDGAAADAIDYNRQDISVEGALLGAADPADLQRLTAGFVIDSLELSVARADFYPLHPQPDYLGNPDLARDLGTPWFDLSLWQTDELPQAWTPLYLFALPGDGEYVNPLHLPAPLNVPMQYLMNFNHLNRFEVTATLDPRNHYDVDAELAAMALRWPLYERAAFYVTGNTDEFNPYNYQRWNPEEPPVGIPAEELPAEALFVWEGEDGLRDGEYDVYIAIDEDLEPLRDAAAAWRGVFEEAHGSAPVDDEELLTPLAEDFLARADAVRADELMFDIEMFTDRNGDGRVWLDGKISQGDVDEAYEDGFPQPWELLRSDFPDPDGAGPLLPDPTAPEYRPSETFGLLQGAHPSSDGLIHYDVVKVENGYLALAIRNWSNRGDLARISRIILTPRNRTPGRININTARTRMARWRDTAGNPERQQWNPLAGLPGVLFAPLAGVAPPFVGSELLSNTSDAALTPDYPGLLPGAGSASGGPLERARAISVSRPEYRDGRYFQTPASLVDYPSERLNDPESPPQRSILSTQVEPLERFQEQYYRFDRMANMITTRSDVFEIIVTAQTGSLAATDQNGDGRIDYRHDFISDGEKKVRIVYER